MQPARKSTTCIRNGVKLLYAPIDHNAHGYGLHRQLCCLGFQQAHGLVRAGIDGHVEFDEGRDGQTIVRLKHACGSSAEVGKTHVSTKHLRYSYSWAVLVTVSM